MKAFQYAMAVGCAALLMSAWAIAAEPIGVNEPGVNRAARGAKPIGVNEPGINRAAPDAKPIGVNEPGVNRAAKRKGGNRGYVVGKGGVARIRARSDAGNGDVGEAEAAAEPKPR